MRVGGGLEGSLCLLMRMTREGEGEATELEGKTSDELQGENERARGQALVLGPEIAPRTLTRSDLLHSDLCGGYDGRRRRVPGMSVRRKGKGVSVAGQSEGRPTHLRRAA